MISGEMILSVIKGTEISPKISGEVIIIVIAQGTQAAQTLNMLNK